LLHRAAGAQEGEVLLVAGGGGGGEQAGGAVPRVGAADRLERLGGAVPEGGAVAAAGVQGDQAGGEGAALKIARLRAAHLRAAGENAGNAPALNEDRAALQRAVRQQGGAVGEQRAGQGRPLLRPRRGLSCIVGIGNAGAFLSVRKALSILVL